MGSTEIGGAALGKWDYQVTYSTNTSFYGSVVLHQPAQWLVFSSFTYLSLIGIVGLSPSTFKPLLHLRPLHNLLLCIFSGISAAVTFWFMWEEGHFNSLESMGCKKIDNQWWPIVSGLFVLSKVWEWFDTVLLVAKGNKLRFLHVLHHSTTFWLFAIGHTFASMKYGVLFNSIVHTVMYAHYYKPFPKPFRKLITQLQIIQFITGLSAHAYIYFTGCDSKIPGLWYEYMTMYALIGAYFMLFCNFYVQQYLLTTPKVYSKTNLDPRTIKKQK
mmetsp:Transcript_1292/g.2033  ORF Transcript_1292/g.2033 Transcript_1292/m.2033 type:complete len:272 (-) Transcript_1292:381-1196(-)